MPNVSFFQANPDHYDVDEYLSRYEYVYWSIKTPLHVQEIRIGDVAYLWRARGTGDGPRGILARCIVTELPKSSAFDRPENLGEDLWIDIGKRAELHVGLLVVQFAPRGTVFVDEERLKNHNVLKKLLTISQKTGTSFREHDEIILSSLRELWNSPFDLVETNDEYSGLEGARQLRTHIYYERDARLVKGKKEAFGNTHSRLYCEICGFDFEIAYGSIGENFIEVHHKIPVSTNQLRETTLDDLMCVCSNCHRMLHRNGALDVNLKHLLARFKK